MAVTEVDGLTFSYPGSEQPALSDVSLRIEPGEIVALLGPSGSGKSTLLRALAGLVPHFHGGRFEGRVVVAGLDTRRFRPADLAGEVATLFQDPEDQVVFGTVANEVAFGLENIGTPPGEIWPRVHDALAEVGGERLAERRTETLSAGELQRVCLASVLALEPALLLLDEPTSQLDPEGAEKLLDLACELGAAVLLSEQRPTLPLERCDRVLFVDQGRISLDAPRDKALDLLPPAYRPREPRSLPETERSGGDALPTRGRHLRVRVPAGARGNVARSPAGRDRRADRTERRGEDDAGEDRRGAPRAGLGKRREKRTLLLPVAGSGSLPRHRAGRGRGGARGRRRPPPSTPSAGRRRPRRLRAAPSPRPFQRRAGAARARGRPRGRPRRAHPRRADAGSRSTPQGGADGSAAEGRSAAGDARRHP